jgi:hypothetical protein
MLLSSITAHGEIPVPGVFSPRFFPKGRLLFDHCIPPGYDMPPNPRLTYYVSLITRYWAGFQAVLPHAHYQRSPGTMTATFAP